MKFKEAVSYATLREFGDLGHLVEHGEFNVGKPKILNYFDLIAYPFNLNRAQNMEL